jgi:hypothetical protein
MQDAVENRSEPETLVEGCCLLVGQLFFASAASDDGTEDSSCHTHTSVAYHSDRESPLRRPVTSAAPVQCKHVIRAKTTAPGEKVAQLLQPSGIPRAGLQVTCGWK